MKTSDLRCIFCGNCGIDQRGETLVCNNCGKVFPSYKGISFLGAYSEEDILGLMEVTSKLSARVDPEEVRRFQDAAEDSYRAQFENWIKDTTSLSKDATFGSLEMAKQVRLREWAAFELLAKSIDFTGKRVLDNGAGLGTDALRLVKRGADLTCLDFNPTSVYFGNLIVPEARWFAATSQCLPFADDSFDISVANAALHHMHDIDLCFREMLRVTRPGGMIMLISDPFIPAGEGADYRSRVEMKVFARHPMVLGGVNEGLIPFNQYYEMVAQCGTIRLLTVKIHRYEDGDKLLEWALTPETREKLGAYSGNISALGTVLEGAFDAPIAVEKISADALFETLGSPSKSWNYLAGLLDQRYFDRFPFTEIEKFDLMNGWLPDMQPELPWRAGYNRRRLFLTREKLSEINSIHIKRYDNGKEHKAQVQVMVNAVPVTSAPVSTEQAMTVAPKDFETLLLDRNVIEIAIKDGSEDKGVSWSTFNSNRVLSAAFF